MVNQPNTLSLSCPAFTPLPQFPTLSLIQNYFNNFRHLSSSPSATSSWFSELSLSPLSVLSFFFLPLPYSVFVPVLIQSSLYIRHHNNHKCSDRFAGTAARGEASEGEWAWVRKTVREGGRERERESLPPKNRAPITVHYVPRSCEMLGFQYNLTSSCDSYIHLCLFFFFSTSLGSDCAEDVLEQTRRTSWPAQLNYCPYVKWTKINISVVMLRCAYCQSKRQLKTEEAPFTHAPNSWTFPALCVSKLNLRGKMATVF